MNTQAFPLRLADERPRMAINLAAVCVFIALAALILDPYFGAFGALMFLIFGGVIIITRPAAAGSAILRFWYLLILPAFCILSTVWSQYPSLSLRYGIQLALTFVVAIAVASRVSAKTFHRCLFGIYGVAILSSILFGRVRDDIGAWTGIFGSKNAFAAVVTGFALTSMTMVLDRTAPLPMRAVALVGVLIAPFLMISAQSTGAMIFLFVGIVVALILHFSRRLSPSQKWLFYGAVSSLAAILIVVGVGYSDVLFASLLASSGKDVTLTGRTDLWEVGTRLIEQRPMLGLGYQAFWVEGNGPAEVLWAMFGISTKMGFHFHNMYISNAVELGLIGLAFQLAILYGALIKTFAWGVRTPNAANIFLASFLSMTATSSFVEVPVFFQFSITSVIVVCSFVYAVRAAQEGRASAFAKPVTRMRKLTNLGSTFRTQARDGSGAVFRPSVPDADTRS